MVESLFSRCKSLHCLVLSEVSYHQSMCTCSDQNQPRCPLLSPNEQVQIDREPTLSLYTSIFLSSLQMKTRIQQYVQCTGSSSGHAVIPNWRAFFSNICSDDTILTFPTSKGETDSLGPPITQIYLPVSLVRSTWYWTATAAPTPPLLLL